MPFRKYITYPIILKSISTAGVVLFIEEGTGVVIHPGSTSTITGAMLENQGMNGYVPFLGEITLSND
jgi:hypothetical protein